MPVRWRVFCITENSWSDGWLDDGITPYRCFNNETHEINLASFQHFENITVNSVRIEQEVIKTGGYYKCKSYEFVVAANTTTTYDLSWSVPITCSAVHVFHEDDQRGNILDVIIAPQTIVGVIVQDVNSMENSVIVNETVIAHSELGYECYIGGHFGGVITGINPDTFTVTFTNQTGQSYPPGTYFYIQHRIIENLQIGYNLMKSIGTNNISGKYLPAGLVTRVYYTNNLSESRVFRFAIEYLF